MDEKLNRNFESHVASSKHEAGPSENFPSLLKNFRGKASQSGLAAMAGLDRSTISRLEDGSRAPSRDVVEAIIETLQLRDVQADRLLASAGFSGYDNTISYDEVEMLSANALLMHPEIPDDAKEKLRAMIGKFVRKYADLLGEEDE